MSNSDYGYRKTVSCDFETAIKKVTEELKKEGFGILTKINIQEKLNEKLGKEMDKYVVLGACNPPLAYEALQVEKEIGLLLPCNVIVYENEGKVVVSAILPTVAMGFIHNLKLRCVADQVEPKLKAVVDRLS